MIAYEDDKENVKKYCVFCGNKFTTATESVDTSFYCANCIIGDNRCGR